MRGEANSQVRPRTDIDVRVHPEVTHDAWLRQRRWEIRRETYSKVLAALYRTQAAEGVNLMELRNGRAGNTPEALQPIFERIRREQLEGAVDYYQILMTALVRVGEEASEILKTYLEDVSRRASIKLIPENIDETLDAYQTATADTFARILDIATKELSGANKER